MTFSFIVSDHLEENFIDDLRGSLNEKDVYVYLYKSLGGGWISPEELEKYAQQLADEQEVDVSTINREELFYNGQIVDLHLTPEEKQARKEEQKAQRKADKERRKQDRQNK